jgi:hypothetical protein
MTTVDSISYLVEPEEASSLVFASETEFDVNWASNVFDTEVLQTKIQPFYDHVGKVAEMSRVQVTTSEGEQKYIFKQVPGSWLSQVMGFAREALVYTTFEEELSGVAPRVVFASGNMETGEKNLIMEEIEGAMCTIACCPQMVLMDCEEQPAPAGWQDLAVTSLAQAQAKLWNQKSLLDCDFLGAASWYRGEGEAAWQTGFSGAKFCWESADKEGLGYAKEVCEMMDAVLKKDTFQDWQEAAAKRPFTLGHGDFHPGNILYKDGEIRIIDWEMSCVAPGIMDLSYFIATQSWDFTSNNWEHLVEVYVRELAKHGVEYPLEDAKRDFIEVTFARMSWWLCVIHHGSTYEKLTHPTKGSMAKQIHDGLLSMIQVFGLTPNDASPLIM